MLFYKKSLAWLAAATLAVVGAGAVPPAAAAENCVHNATQHEFADCLSVKVELDGLPRVGERAGVRIEVAGDELADLTVELPAYLRWVRVPDGLASKDSHSRAPEDRAGVHRVGTRMKSGKLHGTVLAIAPGQAHLRVNAFTARGESASAGAFLTIGHDRTVAGFAVAADETAVPMTGAAPSHAYPRMPVKPAGSSTTPGSACATGAFGYVDTGGVNRIAANSGVQVWDADAAGGDDLLASGVTDTSGAFRLCFNASDEEGGGQDVYAVFATGNTHWVIRHHRTRTEYRFRTETVNNVQTGGTAAFGTRMPGNPFLMRGVQAFDQVGAAWNWTPGNCWDARDTLCRQGIVTWGPDSTDGTWYDLGKDSVFLLPDDPRSAELVLHEFGHAIMDDIYEDAFPMSPKCSPHYIPRTSSRGCAWTEGFATLYEVMVLGQPIFRWADGRTLDVEQPTWGTEGWDNGDRVEGRVLGALIDLYDTNNEGTRDRCVEDPRGPIWTTFLNHRSTTFAQFWSDRKADGFDTSRTALGCLNQNTIVYDGYRP